MPTFIRWPGTIEPGTVVNDVGAHEDMLPTLVAAAGNPNATKQLLDGTTLRMDPFERAQHLRAPGTRPGARQAPSGAARAAGSCCAPSGGAGTWQSSGGGST